MKKLFVIAALVVASMSVSAQSSYVLNGTTFSHVSSGRSTTKDTLVTKYTYETKTGKYTIILNKKSGSCYYWCKSKDGKLYKRYCPKEVSAQVAKAYGVEYKPSTRTSSK